LRRFYKKAEFLTGLRAISAATFLHTTYPQNKPRLTPCIVGFSALSCT
jgi:hypothetical protein